jgi:hypothetical protein
MLLAFFLLGAKNDIEIFLLDIEIVIDFFLLGAKNNGIKTFQKQNYIYRGSYSPS